MKPFITVDLYSDTATKPTPEMRRFMCDAEVGDEQRGEDPTVNLLQEVVAELLGKEAALYLPSGTMCNQIAFAVHCRPGDEIIMDKTAHPLNGEAGGPAALSGVLIHPLDGSRGIFTDQDVTAAIRASSRYAPRSRVVSVEQTANRGGGAIWPLQNIQAVCETAQQHGLITHMDGARLLNAVVATGVSAREYALPFDTVWIDLSKGLGAPVGAVLAGSKAFIEEAWRFKQRFGGAMRQAGIIAAAGVYALKHHVERLVEDHENAKVFAQGLTSLPGFSVCPEEVETNIILFDVAGLGLTAQQFADRMQIEQEVRFSVVGRTVVRAVTHLNISPQDIEMALRACANFIESV